MTALELCKPYKRLTKVITAKAPTGKIDAGEDDGNPSLSMVLKEKECGRVASNKKIKTGRSNATEAHTSSYRPIEQADREHRFNFHGDYMGRLRLLVPFEHIMFDRTMFHVRVARDIKGHSHQMEFEEAHYVSSFWAGEKQRLALLGFEIGSGVLIADLHWLSPPTKTALRTHSDHHLLMKQIQHWPGWKDSNQTGSCNIHLVLEE